MALPASDAVCEHVWNVTSYQVSTDRQNVTISDVCDKCECRRTYQRPNSRARM